MGNDKTRDGNTELLGVRVPDDLRKRLHRRADLLGVSFSDYVRWTLQKAAPPDLEEPVHLDLKEDWTPKNRDEVLKTLEEAQAKKRRKKP